MLPFPDHQPSARRTDLHVCAACASELVFPVTWEESGPEHWAVVLRCPDCESRSSGVYAQEVVERFDEQLDLGTEAMLADLKRLTQANMEDELTRFVAALAAGLIVPDDF